MKKEHIVSWECWGKHTHSWDGEHPRSISEKQSHVTTHAWEHFLHYCETPVAIVGVNWEWWQEWKRKATTWNVVLC